jgi:hypothetical protein
MNCRDFEMNVRALARVELMDAARREVILGHAAICLQCSNRLAGEQALIAGVRAVVADMAGQKAPAHVRGALLTAFREHTSAVAARTVVLMPVKGPLKGTRQWRLEAVAAAVLILVSMGAVFWISSRSPVEQHAALVTPSLPVAINGPPNQPTNPAKQPDSEATGKAATQPPSRPRHRAPRHRTRASEEVSEFFPLMEGIDLDSLEAVQAVRVELPASALSELGLQTSQETGLVRADVLLGVDGLARAIRFVR